MNERSLTRASEESSPTARTTAVRPNTMAAGVTVADLTAARYVVKHKHGRRNHYQIQPHLPLPEPASHKPAIGDVLALLAGGGAGQEPRGSATGHEHAGISHGDQEECSGIL